MPRLNTPAHTTAHRKSEAPSSADATSTPAFEALWGVKTASRFLHTSRSWTYKAVERGELPAVRVGSMLRFRPQDLRSYVNARAQ